MPEDGYLPLYKRADAERVLSTLSVPRELAVVVYGYMYTPDEELEVQKTWGNYLQGIGYRRVVFVYAGETEAVNGLVIAGEFRS